MENSRPVPALLVLLALLALPRVAHAEDIDTDACIAAHEGGQRDRLAGALEAAYAKLSVCASAACPHAIFKDCSQWSAELGKELVLVDIEARDLYGPADKARLRVDGKLPVWTQSGAAVVRPGAHVVTIAAGASGTVARQDFTAKLGERLSVTLWGPPLAPAPSASASPPPPALPAPAVGEPRREVRPVTWALAGGSIVFLGLSAGFGISGLSRRASCETPGTCSRSTIERVDRDYVIADVALGAGLLLGGAAVYTYVRTPITVGLGPRELSLRGTF